MTKRKRAVFLSILFVVSFIVTARSAAAADLDPLRTILPLASYREQFATRGLSDRILQDIFERARDDAGALTEDGFLAMLQRRRAATISAFLQSDLNNDLRVTDEELRAILSQDYVEPTNYVELIASMDINRDGIIALEEARDVADRQLGSCDGLLHSVTVVELLRQLDPDGDGTLTAAEVEEIGAAAFAVYDVDGNGKLSQREAGVLEQQREIGWAKISLGANGEQCVVSAAVRSMPAIKKEPNPREGERPEKK